MGEEEKLAGEKVTWDGHSSSAEAAARAARANISLDDQIAQIHRQKGLIPGGDQDGGGGPAAAGTTAAAAGAAGADDASGGGRSAREAGHDGPDTGLRPAEAGPTDVRAAARGTAAAAAATTTTTTTTAAPATAAGS